MDIQITGRHVPVSDRFREHAQEKLDKIELLANRDPRLDIVVSRHGSANGVGTMTVEITCRVKGPVIRAEATSDDKYAAFDIAADKLLDRLKKANDRRRGKRRKVTTSTEVPAPARLVDAVPGAAAAPPPAADAADAGAAQDDGPEVVEVADSPIEVRVKHHSSAPMNIEQALYEMEMVGHDFFLFTDADCGAPSVLYRRRGWSYGVLHLETETQVEPDLESRST
ncbi:ribosome hibernation-promoting factor, HPF/YfiA family [Arsenicicoccus cauae]|uniref:Ribosome hibernation promoting factor n=1 Tax=Arsenicicoccus cauae TaxID=2663847 RepID=A0A6I3IGU9_9MICO|nr:ribosome-associated translation inhibitor RaiA [Arsenicicoccus cauae]MTB73302.1 ribosome-associated translation inhibitor RaiA [Arsenicicoccus cauae]